MRCVNLQGTFMVNCVFVSVIKELEKGVYN